MREPIERHAPSCGQAIISSQPARIRKQSFVRPLLTALGLSSVMACLPASMALAQDTDEPGLRPAVMSLKASNVLLIDAAHAGDRLVAVGSRGHIVYSDDQGVTWIQSPVPTRQLLTAVHFVDDKNGWAVGHDSLILHSSDAGETWAVQYRDPDLDEELADEDGGLLEKPLMDVWFRDTQTGFAAGAYGLFLRTDDGGETWEDHTFDIDNPEGLHYNAITEVKDTGLFLVGEMGTMYRSSDFGDTWETLEDLPYDGSLFGTSGTGEAGAVLVWGLRGHMYRSADFGDSWERVDLRTASGDQLGATLSGGGLSADGKLVVVGVGGVVVTSNDNGHNFTVSTRPDRVALASAKVLDDGHVLLLGQRGAVKANATGLPTTATAPAGSPADQ